MCEDIVEKPPTRFSNVRSLLLTLKNALPLRWGGETGCVKPKKIYSPFTIHYSLINLFTFSPVKLKRHSLFPISHSLSPAFTLAEVLIVVGIIGIIATITITNLILDAKDMQYKVAYKKAYSDISRAFEEAIVKKDLSRTNTYDVAATNAEWEILKNALKISKECNANNLFNCWADGDTLCKTSCGSAGGHGLPYKGLSAGFIDNSGRAWAQYFNSLSTYVVDTNGFKGPNKFGKDRWSFNIRYGNGIPGHPTKVEIMIKTNAKTSYEYCQYPPCYYYSWLYGN